MGDNIHILSEAVSNQIAAGEVVGRPASVLKELVENSLDAESSHIEVHVTDGGLQLIRITDNGIGMSRLDARVCFERHATSKIKQFADLSHLRTMGFRGEALAAISSVAQVELITRRDADECATRIRIDGAEFKKQDALSAPTGTTISVKNLFYNVPARRAFLKSPSVELKHIIESFQQLALSHPELSMTLNSQMGSKKRTIYQLSPAKLGQRIVAMFGKRYQKQLLPVEEKMGNMHLRGYVGRPELAKNSRGEQYFFLNHRFFKSPYLHHAINQAYMQLISPGAHPFYALGLSLEPSSADVNVHPSKMEVKFEDEKAVYALILSAVRHSLAVHQIVSPIDFTVDANLTSHLEKADALPSVANEKETSGQAAVSKRLQKEAMLEAQYDYQTLSPPEKVLFRTLSKASSADEAAAVSDKKSAQSSNDSTTSQAQVKVSAAETLSVAAPPFQLHGCYICKAVRQGLLIVDQRRAHERILYETLSAQQKTAIQRLVFPVTLSLQPKEATRWNEIKPLITQMGFDAQLEEKDNQNALLSIRSIPVSFAAENLQAVFEQMINELPYLSPDPSQKQKNKIAKWIAKRTTIPVKRTLSVEEMESLLDNLYASQDPHYTADGKAISCLIPVKKIDEWLA